MEDFPFYPQKETNDCGIACLKMIAKYYGQKVAKLSVFKNRNYHGRNISMSELSGLASEIGFKTMAVKLTLDILKQKRPLPCILHWKQNHYIVLFEIKTVKKRAIFHIAEPSGGIFLIEEKAFLANWLPCNSNNGIALIFEA